MDRLDDLVARAYSDGLSLERNLHTRRPSRKLGDLLELFSLGVSFNPYVAKVLHGSGYYGGAESDNAYPVAMSLSDTSSDPYGPVPEPSSPAAASEDAPPEETSDEHDTNPIGGDDTSTPPPTTDPPTTPSKTPGGRTHS
eukprot:jgi/Mesvir1/10420/Mv14365-RA.1